MYTYILLELKFEWLKVHLLIWGRDNQLLPILDVELFKIKLQKIKMEEQLWNMYMYTVSLMNTP